MSIVIRAALVSLLLSTAVPSIAEQPAPPAAPQASTRPAIPDADKVVCEKQTIVGSRLAAKRICKTKAQWAEERLQDRQEIERVQTQRGIRTDE